MFLGFAPLRMLITKTGFYWFASTRKGAEVPELRWCEPGEKAAMEVLLGSKDGFLTARLKNYYNDRNNPLKPKGLSGLSPYFHFGMISTQRCALEARNFRKMHPQVCILTLLYCSFDWLLLKIYL